eukprot:3883222-Pleurochrysis_carterae.AAC.1
MPNSSAAGMDKRVVGAPLSPRCAASARRSAFVAADRRSASSTSRGHASETTHGRCGAPATKTYPPTPSTPLASV